MLNRGIKWPGEKKFAFTIVDDTDFACIRNIWPVYRLLEECKIYATKTVWVYPPRDDFKGLSLQDPEYLEFIRELGRKGFEIGLHCVGSGEFSRDEILEGFERFKTLLGFYPEININHASNPDCIYWGYKRFTFPMSWILKLSGMRSQCSGDEAGSKYFWGDIAKKHILYKRNRVFNGINTSKYDPYTPYRVKSKDEFSNFWFSSSDGHTVEEFNNIIKESSIDSLEEKGGFAIIYTHFALGFVNDDGVLNSEFENSIKRLSKRNGWFVSAGKLLDYLRLARGNDEFAPYVYLLKLDAKWALHRIIKKIKYGR